MSDGAFDTEIELKEHKVKHLLNEPKALAKQRLIDFAASLPTDAEGDYDDEGENYVVTKVGEPVTYTELIERAAAYQEYGDFWTDGPRFEGTSIYAGFWEDYALVTGKTVDPNNAYGFFSCSC